MKDDTLRKLKILAESAKYDVSCSSSGTVRRNVKGGVGNTVGGIGICHSFAEDGRCISLLKVMLTNYCIYDCAYCINRRTNDIPRATLSVSELVDLTMEFYKRNYIEGLFLSSGVVRNPDYTMERLVRVVKDLRTVHRFNGYIHLKSIPGASRELVDEAGLYADRMSVNIEIPNEASLKLLAPEKDHESVYGIYTARCTGGCGRTEKTPACSPFCSGRTEHANDCGSNRGVRPGYFVPLVRIVRSAYHAACVLFRLCGREYVRPSPSGSETTTVGQGKPFVSGRLVDEVLSVQSGRDCG